MSEREKVWRVLSNVSLVLCIIATAVSFALSLGALEPVSGAGVLFLAIVAFCLGCGIVAKVAGWDLNRRLKWQEGRLQSELATERDQRLLVNRRVESAVRLINHAVGMLQADKRSGDKAIGYAREELETSLRTLIPPEEQAAAENSIRQEMNHRLVAVKCPTEMAVEIVEAAMDHTPRAHSAVCKLQAWARVLQTDSSAGSPQESKADYCRRAATVKLAPEETAGGREQTLCCSACGQKYEREQAIFGGYCGQCGGTLVVLAST